MLIGLTGKARSGKSTAAEYLVKQHGFEETSFAGPLRDMLSTVLHHWGEEHFFGKLKEVDDPRYGFSPRKAMQVMGTEIGRQLNPNLWVLLMDERTTWWGDRVVISDIRFENEAAFVRDHGGTVLHIHRPGAGASGGIEGHASERSVAIASADHIVNNNGTVEQFCEAVRKAAGV